MSAKEIQLTARQRKEVTPLMEAELAASIAIRMASEQARDASRRLWELLREFHPGLSDRASYNHKTGTVREFKEEP